MRVLLVEDSAADARMVREMFKEAGISSIELVHAPRLEQALGHVAGDHFDAILLDLGLPDARGLEALDPVHSAAPDVPIVVLSGLQDESVALEAVQRGAQDYLIKGVGDGRALVRSLRYAIERKRSELHIHHVANHDGLTSLPNRRLFIDRLSQALARTRREKKILALLFLDIDHFKQVNDGFGHGIGDLLLQAVAARLSACVRECDTIARLGGDEFTIVLPEVAHIRDVNRFAAKVLDLFKAPFYLDGREHRVTASVGISLYPNDAHSVDALLRCADAAMYRAKRRGRNLYQFYSNVLELDGADWLALGNGLREAVQNDELVLHYQPRVSAHSRRVVGIEALVRWDHPGWGLLPPSRFIPLAEEIGFIVPIGRWVLRSACAQARKWNQLESGEPVHVSINLSSREIGQPDLKGTVLSVLEETGLPPEQLELELTETGLVRDEDAALTVLAELSEMGVRISIDDFGTGYSSFNRLRRFPLHALKIDRTFVHDMTSDLGDAAIVSGIITMGHGMGLKVVAEGVETPEQVTALSLRGCDELQGYYFGAPSPPEAMAGVLGVTLGWPDVDEAA